MALFQNTSVTVSSLGGGTFSLQIGPEGYTFTREDVRAITKGTDKDVRYMLFQIALQLDAQGIDPANLTLAQLKATIEAMVLKW